MTSFGSSMNLVTLCQHLHSVLKASAPRPTWARDCSITVSEFSDGRVLAEVKGRRHAAWVRRVVAEGGHDATFVVRQRFAGGGDA